MQCMENTGSGGPHLNLFLQYSTVFFTLCTEGEGNNWSEFLSPYFLPFREVVGQNPDYYIIVMVAPCEFEMYVSTIDFTLLAFFSLVLIMALLWSIGTMDFSVMSISLRCLSTAVFHSEARDSLEALGSLYWIKTISRLSTGVSILLVTNPSPEALMELGLNSSYEIHL